MKLSPFISLALLHLSLASHEMATQLAWLIGTWHSHEGGTVMWPSVPTLRFSETIEIWPSEVSETSGRRFLNWTSVSWAAGAGGDHFHNEYAFFTHDPNTNEAFLFTTGNNGFNTVERGKLLTGALELESEAVARNHIARELPTEHIRREYTLLYKDTMQLKLFMRTESHPRYSKDEIHAVNTYTRVKKMENKGRRLKTG